MSSGVKESVDHISRLIFSGDDVHLKMKVEEDDKGHFVLSRYLLQLMPSLTGVKLVMFFRKKNDVVHQGRSKS